MTIDHKAFEGAPRPNRISYADYEKLASAYDARLSDHKRMSAEIERLRGALLDAKLKVQLYRENSDGDYVGGVEYTALLKKIDAALASSSEPKE